jgi:hypothetical protein
VSAEVIVIVEHQHALVWQRVVPEVRGSEAGQTSADDYEVVGFAGVDVNRRKRLEAALTNAAERFNGARVLPSQPEARRRICIRQRGHLLRASGNTAQRCIRAANANRHAVQEVTPLDAAIHAKLAEFR